MVRPWCAALIPAWWAPARRRRDGRAAGAGLALLVALVSGCAFQPAGVPRPSDGGPVDAMIDASFVADAPAATDAATTDAATTDAAAADAATADAATFAGVECDTTTCTEASTGCCRGNASTTCTTAAGCVNPANFYACDGPEDCADAQVCCEPTPGKGSLCTDASECMDNNERELCHVGAATCNCVDGTPYDHCGP